MICVLSKWFSCQQRAVYIDEIPYSNYLPFFWRVCKNNNYYRLSSLSDPVIKDPVVGMLNVLN